MMEAPTKETGADGIIREMAVQQMLAIQYPSDSVMGRDLRAICLSTWKERWLVKSGKKRSTVTARPP